MFLCKRDVCGRMCLFCMLQAEEEKQLRAQVSGLSEELASEKCRTTEMQKALEQSQEGRSKLQSDLYGKESEVSALHQDLKVHLHRKERTSALFMA